MTATRSVRVGIDGTVVELYLDPCRPAALCLTADGMNIMRGSIAGPHPETVLEDLAHALLAAHALLDQSSVGH